MRKLLLLFVGLIFYPLFSQVGIGTENPNLKSSLDIVSNNTGVLFPRLTEVQRDAINPGNTEDGLLIYNIDESCYNYWNAPSNSWASLCIKSETPAYTIDCISAVVNGSYVSGTLLNSSNTITLPVNVTTIGAYTISSNTVNGYSFSGSGTFTSTGVQNVTLTGSGTPLSGGTNSFTLTSNGGGSTCPVSVTVTAPNVSYTIDCISAVVNGSYVSGTLLNSSNTITLPVNVTTIGAYTISSNTVNGYSFSGSGTFTSTGVQNVTLTGSGTPLSGGTNSFTLTSNGGGSTCPVSVTVTNQVHRRMKVLALGDEYNSPDNGFGNLSVDRLVKSSSNFGPSGTYNRTEGIDLTHSFFTDMSLRTAISNGNYDIVIIAWNYIPQPEDITALNTLMDTHNGVVIDFQQQGTALFNRVFGTSYGTILPAGPTAYSATSANHPILNGPFIDLRGRLLTGDNNMYEGSVNSTPSNGTLLWSISSSQPLSIVHNSKGYLWNADGGFPNDLALSTSSNGRPTTFTPSWSSQPTYNSYFYANALAWAIDYIIANKL